MIRTGRKNLITDVPGIRVGNAEHERHRTGVTVIRPDEAAVTSVDVRGGGPGTRETEALNADCLVEMVHALVLSGGSAFGLDSAGGVMAWLAERKIGFPVGDAIVPIVPAAILFDLLNGGDKEWGDPPPYRDLGYQAVQNAGADFRLGNAGCGYGAVAGGLKGGLGSASLVYSGADADITVGALAGVNAMGSLTFPDSPTFWAYPWERDGELGGQPTPQLSGNLDLDFNFELPVGKNTTIVAVATDAALTKSQARRVAIMAQDGMSRAIRPIHSPFDGDSVFVMSTGRINLSDPTAAISRLGMLAADCVTRAIARGVFEAENMGSLESYRSRFGSFLRHS